MDSSSSPSWVLHFTSNEAVAKQMAYLSMGEAQRRITDYMNRFCNAVSSQDVTSLESLFSLSSNSFFLLSLADALNLFQSAFTQEFRNWESAWALEALYVVVYEIRILAERADKELASNGKSPEKLKGASSFLMEVFGVVAVWFLSLDSAVFLYKK